MENRMRNLKCKVEKCEPEKKKALGENCFERQMEKKGLNIRETGSLKKHEKILHQLTRSKNFCCNWFLRGVVAFLFLQWNLSFEVALPLRNPTYRELFHQVTFMVGPGTHLYKLTLDGAPGWYQQHPVWPLKNSRKRKMWYIESILITLWNTESIVITYICFLCYFAKHLPVYYFLLMLMLASWGGQRSFAPSRRNRFLEIRGLQIWQAWSG